MNLLQQIMKACTLKNQAIAFRPHPRIPQDLIVELAQCNSQGVKTMTEWEHITCDLVKIQGEKGIVQTLELMQGRLG